MTPGCGARRCQSGSSGMAPRGACGCRRRSSGNMAAGGERRPNIGLETTKRRWWTWRGLRTTPAGSRTLSTSLSSPPATHRSRARLAWSACMGMSWSGVPTAGPTATPAARMAGWRSRRPRRSIHLEQTASACSAAGRGTSPPGGAGRPPASGAGPMSATAAGGSVFAWSAVRQPKKNQQAAEPPGGGSERRGSRRGQTRPAEQGRRQTEPASLERRSTFGRRIR